MSGETLIKKKCKKGSVKNLFCFTVDRTNETTKRISR